MQYIICSNGNYLCQNRKGKWSVVYNIDEATKWDEFNKANNVVNTNCRQIEGLKDLIWEVKNVSEKIKIESITDTSIVSKCDVLEKVKEIHAVTNELKERKTYLLEELSNIDLEIVDIEHAAEFYNLNASQGYKLYRLLHDSRVKRRGVKDELQKINFALGSSIGNLDLENLERSILGLDNRKYTPRINKELFGV